MSHIIADQVAESSTTTGTGALTVAGALTGFRAISSVCAVGDTFPYRVWGVDGSGNDTGEWETGLATYSATNTVTRTTVQASSNSGASVNFSAGTKYIALSINASEYRQMPTVVLASDATNSTTTLANVTGMSFSAEANAVYEVELFGAYQTAATTTGIAVALDVPTGASVIGMNMVSTSATALGGTEQIADAATTGATTGVRAATTNTPILAKWIVATGGTAGTVQLMHRSEVASSGATLKANLTYLKARRIK